MTHDTDGSSLPRRAVEEPSRAAPEDDRSDAAADLLDDASTLGQGTVGRAVVDAVEAAAVTDEQEDAPGAATTTARKQVSVGRASAVMAMGSLASRILGMVRTSLLAAAVGTVAAAGDAFSIANVAPNLIFTLLNAGILNAVLIPQITKAMKRDDGGQDFVDRLVTAAIAAIALVAVVSTLATPLLIDLTSDLDGPAFRLAVLFGYLTLPQIFFYGLYAVLGNVLNARDQFAAFMWAPAAANVVQIAGLVYFLVEFGRHGSALGWTSPMIWVLAGSATLGIVAQALVLIPPLVRGGFRYRPRWGLRGRGFGQASRMLGWTLTALTIAQVGGLFVSNALTSVNKGLAEGHQHAGNAAYQAALTIFMLPHGLLTVSILTALFPRMTRTWNDRDVAGLRQLVRQGLTAPAVGIIPATAGLVALAGPIVGVLFPGNTPAEQHSIAQALQVMSLGLLGFGISVLQQRFSFAREEGRQNLVYQVVLTAVQIAFAVVAWFVLDPRWALLVVSAGLVVANWVVSLAFMVVADRQLDGLGLGRVLGLWARLAAASSVAGAVAWYLARVVRALGDGIVPSLLQCLAGGAGFVAVFALLAALLRIREVADLVAPLRRRLPF